MLGEFDKYGIEPVETMARWKWCKIKEPEVLNVLPPKAELEKILEC